MRHFCHPNVLSMIGLVVDKNMPMVVMPYMANGDLRQYIANPNNVSMCKDLVRQEWYKQYMKVTGAPF